MLNPVREFIPFSGRKRKRPGKSSRHKKRVYARTKVDDIAALARVSPMTIYSGLGGKAGLLRTLMDLWSTTPGIDTALEEVRSELDPRAVIAKVALGIRLLREEFADIAYFMHDAAPHDAEVAANLAIATKRYRLCCSEVVKHLRNLRALRSELSDEQATDIFWFFFGYWGFYTLHNENEWSYQRAQEWLTQAAVHALLKPEQERLHL